MQDIRPGGNVSGRTPVKKEPESVFSELPYLLSTPSIPSIRSIQSDSSDLSDIKEKDF